MHKVINELHLDQARQCFITLDTLQKIKNIKKDIWICFFNLHIVFERNKDYKK